MGKFDQKDLLCNLLWESLHTEMPQRSQMNSEQLPFFDDELAAAQMLKMQKLFCLKTTLCKLALLGDEVNQKSYQQGLQSQLQAMLSAAYTDYVLHNPSQNPAFPQFVTEETLFLNLSSEKLDVIYMTCMFYIHVSYYISYP